MNENTFENVKNQEEVESSKMIRRNIDKLIIKRISKDTMVDYLRQILEEHDVLWRHIIAIERQQVDLIDAVNLKKLLPGTGFPDLIDPYNFVKQYRELDIAEDSLKHQLLRLHRVGIEKVIDVLEKPKDVQIPVQLSQLDFSILEQSKPVEKEEEEHSSELVIDEHS